MVWFFASTWAWLEAARRADVETASDRKVHGLLLLPKQMGVDVRDEVIGSILGFGRPGRRREVGLGIYSPPELSTEHDEQVTESPVHRGSFAYAVNCVWKSHNANLSLVC